jgi:hypothetical protein
MEDVESELVDQGDLKTISSKMKLVKAHVLDKPKPVRAVGMVVVTSPLLGKITLVNNR